MVPGRLWPGHIGCHRPKETVTQEEDKGSGAAHHTRADQIAVCPVAFTPMVTRARFAANQQRLPVWSAIDAFQAPRCPLLNDLNQRAAGRCCHLRSEHTFAWHWWTGHER